MTKHYAIKNNLTSYILPNVYSEFESAAFRLSQIISQGMFQFSIVEVDVTLSVKEV